MLPIDAANVRAVTHLDVDAADVDRAGEILAEAAQAGAARLAAPVQSY